MREEGDVGRLCQGLVERLSKAVSVANLGVGAIIEVKGVDERVVNCLMLVEDLVVECREIAERLSLQHNRSVYLENS